MKRVGILSFLLFFFCKYFFPVVYMKYHPLRDSSKIKKYAFRNRCCGDQFFLSAMLLFSHKLKLIVL